ncbi:MAG: secondary thiamine-phosphate synthase enzyme YjbQ [Candidatus Kapaibacterium sp.]
MVWYQREISLPSFPRGVHLITRLVEEGIPELRKIRVGLAQIFILHTSASLAINENADPDVRHDIEAHMNRMVPENVPYYRHTMEGSDDMPAHIKAMLFGSGLTIPINRGGFRLGTWQGIYLCEHRNRGGSRRLVVTLFGEE